MSGSVEQHASDMERQFQKELLTEFVVIMQQRGLQDWWGEPLLSVCGSTTLRNRLEELVELHVSVEETDRAVFHWLALPAESPRFDNPLWSNNDTQNAGTTNNSTSSSSSSSGSGNSGSNRNSSGNSSSGNSNNTEEKKEKEGGRGSGRRSRSTRRYRSSGGGDGRGGGRRRRGDDGDLVGLLFGKKKKVVPTSPAAVMNSRGNVKYFRKLCGQQRDLRQQLKQDLITFWYLLQAETLQRDEVNVYRYPIAVRLCSCLDLLQRLFLRLPCCAEVLFEQKHPYTEIYSQCKRDGDEDDDDDDDDEDEEEEEGEEEEDHHQEKKKGGEEQRQQQERRREGSHHGDDASYRSGQEGGGITQTLFMLPRLAEGRDMNDDDDCSTMMCVNHINNGNHLRGPEQPHHSQLRSRHSGHPAAVHGQQQQQQQEEEQEEQQVKRRDDGGGDKRRQHNNSDEEEEEDLYELEQLQHMYNQEVLDQQQEQRRRRRGRRQGNNSQGETGYFHLHHLEYREQQEARRRKRGGGGGDTGELLLLFESLESVPEEGLITQILDLTGLILRELEARSLRTVALYPMCDYPMLPAIGAGGNSSSSSSLLRIGGGAAGRPGGGGANPSSASSSSSFIRVAASRAAERVARGTVRQRKQPPQKRGAAAKGEFHFAGCVETLEEGILSRSNRTGPEPPPFSNVSFSNLCMRGRRLEDSTFFRRSTAYSDKLLHGGAADTAPTGDEQLPRYPTPFFYRLEGCGTCGEGTLLGTCADTCLALCDDEILDGLPFTWACVYIFQRLLRLISTIAETVQQQRYRLNACMRQLQQLNWKELQEEWWFYAHAGGWTGKNMAGVGRQASYHSDTPSEGTQREREMNPRRQQNRRLRSRRSNTRVDGPTTRRSNGAVRTATGTHMRSPSSAGNNADRGAAGAGGASGGATAGLSGGAADVNQDGSRERRVGDGAPGTSRGWHNAEQFPENSFYTSPYNNEVLIEQEQQRRECMQARRDREVLRWRRERSERRQQRNREIRRIAQILDGLYGAVRDQLLQPLNDLPFLDDLLYLHALMDPPASVVEPFPALLLLQPDLVNPSESPGVSPTECELLRRCCSSPAMQTPQADTTAAAAAAGGSGGDRATDGAAQLFHTPMHSGGYDAAAGSKAERTVTSLSTGSTVASNETSLYVELDDSTLGKLLRMCVLLFQHPPPPLVEIRLNALQVLRRVLLLSNYSFAAASEAAQCENMNPRNMSGVGGSMGRYHTGSGSSSSSSIGVGSAQGKENEVVVALAEKLLQSISVYISPEATVWMQQSPQWLYGPYFLQILSLLQKKRDLSSSDDIATLTAVSIVTGHTTDRFPGANLIEHRPLCFAVPPIAARDEAALRLRLTASQLFDVLLRLPLNESLVLGKLDTWKGATTRTPSLLQRIVLLTWSMLLALDEFSPNRIVCCCQSRTEAAGGITTVRRLATKGCTVPLYQPVELQQLLMCSPVDSEGEIAVIARATCECLQEEILRSRRQPRLSFLKQRIDAARRIWGAGTSVVERTSRTTSAEAANASPASSPSGCGSCSGNGDTNNVLSATQTLVPLQPFPIVQIVAQAHVRSHCILNPSVESTGLRTASYCHWPPPGVKRSLKSLDCVRLQLVLKTLQLCLRMITHGAQTRDNDGHQLEQAASRRSFFFLGQRGVMQNADNEASFTSTGPTNTGRRPTSDRRTTGLIRERLSTAGSPRRRSNVNSGGAFGITAAAGRRSLDSLYRRRTSRLKDSLMCGRRCRAKSRSPIVLRGGQLFVSAELLTRTWPVLMAIAGKLNSETHSSALYGPLVEYAQLLKDLASFADRAT